MPIFCATADMDPGTTNSSDPRQQTISSNENSETNDEGQDDKSSGETAKESEGQDDKSSGETAKESEDQDDKSSGETAKESERKDDKSSGETAKESESQDDKGSSETSEGSASQDDKSSGETAKESGGQDDKSSDEASKETEDSQKGNDSASGKTNEGASGKAESEKASSTDKGKEVGDEKESTSKTEEKNDKAPNQAPRKITLSGNSIYEGKESGSIVGQFAVVDPDDPGRKGGYKLEFVSIASSSRRVGRTNPSSENTKSETNEDKAGDSSKLSEGISKSTTVEKITAEDKENAPQTTNDPAAKSTSTETKKDNSASKREDSKSKSSTVEDAARTTSGGEFRIDDKGRLRITRVLDYETKNKYNLRVKATDEGGLSVEQNFVIKVKNAFIPIARTVGVTKNSTRHTIVSGEILADGYSQVTEVGVVVSKQPRFQAGDKHAQVTRGNRVSKYFKVTIVGLEPETTYYFRAYASNSEGASHGAVNRFTTPESDNGPWANTEAIGNGWFHSDWLGHLYPTENGWVYHTELGWLYAKKNDSGGVWLYSNDFLGWFWTGPQIFPFVYSGQSRAWAYYQGILSDHRVFYHFGQNSWMAVSRKDSPKAKGSQRPSTANKSSSSRKEVGGKTSAAASSAVKQKR